MKSKMWVELCSLNLPLFFLQLETIQTDLLEQISGDLLTVEAYEETLREQPSRNHENSLNDDKDGDGNEVMITVHLIKTMLRKGSNRSKKMKISPCLQNTKIVILALGGSELLSIPKQFSYHDPLNAWRSETRFFSSSIIKNAIAEDWEKLRSTVQPPCEIPSSVAKHIMLIDKNGALKKIELSVSGGKIRYEDKLLECLSHGPDRNSLHHVLMKSVPFLEACKNWLCSGDQGILAKIKMEFFDREKLPTSYKFDTTKFKHTIMSRPNQVGATCSSSTGKLHLLSHNEAHMKFTELENPAQQFDDEGLIREKLEEYRALV